MPSDIRYLLFGARGKDQFIAIAASSTPQVAMNRLTKLTTYFLKCALVSIILKTKVMACAIIKKEKITLASWLS